MKTCSCANLSALPNSFFLWDRGLSEKLSSLDGTLFHKEAGLYICYLAVWSLKVTCNYRLESKVVYKKFRKPRESIHTMFLSISEVTINSWIRIRGVPVWHYWGIFSRGDFTFYFNMIPYKKKCIKIFYCCFENWLQQWKELSNWSTW